MAPSFSKEAILTGEIDHICLVCEIYMKSDHEITAHISDPAHKKNLENTNYVEKYKTDCIRKIKKWYFCEFCNIVLSTLTKVGLHVEEIVHKDNKSSKTIERRGDFVILLDNVAVNEESWHGFIENTCTVCNLEFDDTDDHKNESTHIINLIKSKVSYADNNIYRKIDNFTFHCLTCNVVVAEITTHFLDTKHRALLEKCQKIHCENEVHFEKNSSRKPFTEKDKIENEKDANEIDNIHDNEKDDNEADTCLDHIKVTETPCDKHNENIKSTDKYKTESDSKFDQHIREALEANYYNYRLENGNILCILCDLILEAPNVKTHFECEHHQTLLKMHKKRGEQLNTSAKNEKLESDRKHDASDIIDSLDNLQTNNINIHFESRIAFCKICSKNLEFNLEIIENHIQEHKNPVKEKKSSDATPSLLGKDEKNKSIDSTTLFTSPVSRHRSKSNNKDDVVTKPTKQQEDCTETIQKLVEKHDLRKSSNNKVYCSSCKNYITAAVKNIKEHVSGERHSNNMQSSTSVTKKKNTKTNKCELKKVPSHNFVQNFTMINNAVFQDVVINEKYCINFLSFAFLTKIYNDQLKCQVCHVNFGVRSLPIHLREEKHDRAWRELPVIINVDTEFIREIRSGFFHCGFCNIINSSWVEMEEHLKLTSHKESKTSANWRLVQYLSDIRRESSQVQNDLFKHLHMMLSK